MLTHVYAAATVPAADAVLLRALLQAERGLERAGAVGGIGYDRLVALCADGRIYRIVVSEGDAQTRALYQVLEWFGCKKVEAEPRPGIDELFEVPRTSSLRTGARAGACLERAALSRGS